MVSVIDFHSVCPKGFFLSTSRVPRCSPKTPPLTSGPGDKVLMVALLKETQMTGVVHFQFACSTVIKVLSLHVLGLEEHTVWHWTLWVEFLPGASAM